MARRNRDKKRKPNSAPAESAVASPADGPAPTAAATPEPFGPSSATRGVVSLLIAGHLIALAASYFAIIEPSSTHSSLLSALTPYLRATHFAADGRPFYLAHATPDEQPHRLQTASLGDGESITTQTEWTTIRPSGFAGLAPSDRYGRWMKLVGTLAESDRPSLAASLLLPLIESDSSIDAVRVIRLPTELTTVADDTAPAAYVAKVVRDGDEVQLVSLQSRRLTTIPVDAAPEVPGTAP